MRPRRPFPRPRREDARPRRRDAGEVFKGIARMKLDQHYTDPRLVELYDIDNPRGADTDFYVQLAADLAAHRILDLGCGTGLLTRELAVADRQVVGIDPSSAMLAVPCRQPGAARVQWVGGPPTPLGTPPAAPGVITRTLP